MANYLGVPSKNPAALILLGIVKLTDFMGILLIAMPAKLLILGLGLNRFCLENELFLVNLTVPTPIKPIHATFTDIRFDILLNISTPIIKEPLNPIIILDKLQYNSPLIGLPQVLRTPS